MKAYIKNYATFQTESKFDVTSWDIVLDSLTTQKSTITVAGSDVPSDAARKWLVFDSKPYWIDVVSPSKAETKITVLPFDEIFNRNLLYDGTTAASVGAFIAAVIGSEWVNQTDGAYSTPYIQTTVNDTTAFFAPATDDNGMWNLLSYIRMARQKFNVGIHASIDKDHLVLEIRKDSSVEHPLVIDDGHTQLNQVNYAAQITAKATVVQPVDTGIVDAEGSPIYQQTKTDWYLSKDGTASTTVPANRADGSWVTIVISAQDDQSEKVREEFAKNGESHKVEVYTDTAMKINDKFRVKLNGAVFVGSIIEIKKTSKDSRTLYRSGSLETTISEKVNNTSAAVDKASGYTGDGSGQMYAVGDIYITTRTGNPATLLGYGAWEQIQGRFLFAADSNHSVQSKGGNSTHTLSADELPSFSAKVKVNNSNELYMQSAAGSGSARTVPQLTGDNGTLTADFAGKNDAFSIMPPYFTVYVWLRKE